MQPRHGEVWIADLGMTAKIRPVVVLMDDQVEVPRSVIVFVPVTSQSRGSEFEIPLGHLYFLQKDSAANVQGIGIVANARFERRLGILPADDLLKIKLALKKLCALP
ncbi:MAG: type II toxin-antitoxin system PemK/MazF family toxin [Prosthecobacter sp.]|nr:type II toxin-antitoxin system PemK/MazF family toxin [Prosthecobacter sp.]